MLLNDKLKRLILTYVKIVRLSLRCNITKGIRSSGVRATSLQRTKRDADDGGGIDGVLAVHDGGDALETSEGRIPKKKPRRSGSDLGFPA